MIDYYIKEIKKYGPLERSEEKELIEKAKKGDKWSYDLIIKSNLRFVFQIAKSYQNKGLPLEDLIAEGNLGLIKALNRFDLTKNVKFISYAVWWVRQSILSALYAHSSVIRLPLNKLINVNKIQKVKEQLQQELYREPTREEILEYLDDPTLKEDVDHLHTIMRLDLPRTENGEGTLHEIIGEDLELSHEEKFKYLEEELSDIMANFPEREKRILFLYYGIGYDRTYNLREIGVLLSLTRERIRQIKEQTLNKLRNKPEGKALLDFL